MNVTFGVKQPWVLHSLAWNLESLSKPSQVCKQLSADYFQPGSPALRPSVESKSTPTQSVSHPAGETRGCFFKQMRLRWDEDAALIPSQSVCHRCFALFWDFLKNFFSNSFFLSLLLLLRLPSSSLTSFPRREIGEGRRAGAPDTDTSHTWWQGWQIFKNTHLLNIFCTFF